ncbi:MAG TPA: choice-of-anchor D domain-containing protein [Candidatus Dormibacteraeota bacterium]|nr:choice-of-anchor D domain-containing protein [Candidatus Dormibacteraeota bacterium]
MELLNPKTSFAASRQLQRRSRLLASFTLLFVLLASAHAGKSAASRISVIPDPVNFQTVVVGQKNTQSMQIANLKASYVQIRSIQVVGAGFVVNTPAFPAFLRRGGKLPFTLAFTPAGAGTFHGAIIVRTNDGIAVQIPVQGTGVKSAGQLQLNPPSINFGNVAVGGTTGQTVTLTNTGNVDVVVSSAAISGSLFGLSKFPSGVKLSPRQQLPFTVSFDAKTKGAASGTLTVSSSIGLLKAPLAGYAAAGHSVHLTWQASTSPAAGYHVYRSQIPGASFARLTPALVASLDFVDIGVQAGATYYYVVTAVDYLGVESGFSQSSAARIPTP